jgi:hypothetical protein
VNPELLRLEEQKKAVRRARAQGRRWILRGILLAVVAVVAFLRGGSFYRSLGVALAIVAVLAAHLGWQMRRTAAEMERKIDLMASADARVLPKPGPHDPRPTTQDPA